MMPLPYFLLLASLTNAAATAESILIEDVPHVFQKPDFCGEACTAMALGKLGYPADQDLVFDRSGLEPLEGRGCRTRELAAALRSIGFKAGDVWHSVRAASAADLEALWGGLIADLRLRIPSIVCMRYSAAADAPEHFRLVVGHDAEKDEVVYHEPAEEGGAYRRMSRKDFLALWPLKYERDRWTVIRLRLEPGTIDAAPSGERLTAADYAQHVMKLKRKAPPGFSMALSPPFVVLGDEPAETVKRRAGDTVGWAVARLKEAYFERDPDGILEVWLFKDKESYEKHVKAVFGKSPTTPFGFYSAANEALIMNIATGGGTLVHEIVHPYMRANFPLCPTWFNEGLASLYEQSAQKDGSIVGRTNWRLSGLQNVIRASRLSSFKNLTASGEDGFYNFHSGTNYAQARYLCYYLQEEGLLRTFYREFLEAASNDPTGFATLAKVLGKREEEMAGFQKEWEGFVMALRFE